MVLGGNPNKKGKPQAKLGGGGGTEYKGLQADAGATFGYPPIGGNNVTNELGPGRENRPQMLGTPGQGDGGTGFADPALGQVAEIIQRMAQMYRQYNPPNLTSNATAKALLREEQMRGRKPPNEGAFYVGY